MNKWWRRDKSLIQKNSKQSTLKMENHNHFLPGTAHSDFLPNSTVWKWRK